MCEKPMNTEKTNALLFMDSERNKQQHFHNTLLIHTLCIHGIWGFANDKGFQEWDKIKSTVRWSLRDNFKFDFKRVLTNWIAADHQDVIIKAHGYWLIAVEHECDRFESNNELRTCWDS